MDESMKPEEAKTRFQGDPGDEQVDWHPPVFPGHSAGIGEIYAYEWDVKQWRDRISKPFTNRNA